MLHPRTNAPPPPNHPPSPDRVEFPPPSRQVHSTTPPSSSPRARLQTAAAAVMSPPHDSARAPPARPSRGHQPSFSAALLDAIYQSLEADAEARSSTETRPAPASPAQRTPGSSRHHRTTAAVSSPARSSVRSPRLQRPPRPCRVRPDPQPNPILLPPAHELTGERAEKKKTRRNRKSKRKTKAKESSESSSDLFELESLPAFEDAEPPRPRASAGAGLLTRPRPRLV